jgi:hypothetical protein
MDQDKEIYITSRKGEKRSPASPAPCSGRPSKGRAQSAFKVLNYNNFRSASPRHLRTSKCSRDPDPVVLHRVSKLLAAGRYLFNQEVTTVWLARALARADGGPILDAPRLGSALRRLGFRSARRRRGTRRVSIWLRPGAPHPCVGRPPQHSHQNVRTIGNRREQRHGY